MKQIKTLNQANLKQSAVKGGCGECQASCQSACKTSCTVANQKCREREQSIIESKSLFRDSVLSLKFLQ